MRVVGTGIVLITAGLGTAFASILVGLNYYEYDFPGWLVMLRKLGLLLALAGLLVSILAGVEALRRRSRV